MRRSKGPRLYQRKPRRRGGEKRWVILDSDANGHPVEVSTGAFGGSRAEAEKFFADYLAKKHVPSFGGGHPAEVLIADVLSFYAEAKPLPARAANLVTSLVQLGTFFTGKRICDLTPQLCQDYVYWRIRQGDARGSNKWRSKAPTQRLLETTTARNDLIVLDAAQRYCWRNHKLSQFVPIIKPPASKARLRFLSTSEAARLLAATLGWDQHGCRHHRRINRHLARLVLIGLYTGTRRDRITRLQWVENLAGGWVDLERGILHRKSKAEPDTKKRAPSIPLADAPGANALWAHLRRWRKLTARFVIEHNGYPVRAVFKGFEGACQLAGLNYDGQPADDRVTPHTLRHTCVSWALAEGKSPLQVGQYVGMTAAMVEKTYAHTNEALQRETANVIGRRNIPDSSQRRPKNEQGRAEINVNEQRWKRR